MYVGFSNLGISACSRPGAVIGVAFICGIVGFGIVEHALVNGAPGLGGDRGCKAVRRRHCASVGAGQQLSKPVGR